MSRADNVAAPLTDDAPRETEGKRRSAPVRAWRATRAIAKDPAGTASLLALLFGFVLSAVPAPKEWSNGLHSVGYALVGAAAFSFIYQFWANDALVRLISANVKRTQRRAARDIGSQWSRAIAKTTSSLDGYMDRIISLHRRHWPLEVYPEGDIPNPQFNQKLESDLGHAARYDFRGQSGKHVASRLIQTRYRRLRVVRMVIEDAIDPDVANARIDEKRWSEPDRFQDVSDEELRAIVRDDLFDSLVGLYIARLRFDRIEIAYASRPTDVRIEITDGVVYISPYIRNRSRGNRYPEVFRYDPESIPAQIAVLEFDREFALLSESKVVFEPNTTRETLLEHLRKKKWNISPEEFDLRYRRSQEELRALGTVLNAAPEEPGRSEGSGEAAD
jgi:hypothetical protein